MEATKINPHMSAAPSDMFTFIVGPDKKRMTIHSALVCYHSPVLKAMINGQFKEGTEMCVDWTHIDEETFMSFWQFLYMENYSIPPPHERATEEAETSCDVSPQGKKRNRSEYEAEADTNIGLPQRRDLNDKSPTRQSKLWKNFIKSRCGTGQTTVEGHDNLSERTDRAHVLVHHAKVYTLADCYGIQRLAKKAMGTLSLCLEKSQFFSLKFTDIMALIEYCFENTVPNDLKLCIMHYAACNAKTLWKQREFRSFTVTHWESSGFFIAFIMKRLD